VIALPPLGGDGDRLWNSLLDITDRMPDDWTLIGGQMVLLHALEAGQAPPRVSEDLDMVVNARVRPHTDSTVVEYSSTSSPPTDSARALTSRPSTKPSPSRLQAAPTHCRNPPPSMSPTEPGGVTCPADRWPVRSSARLEQLPTTTGPKGTGRHLSDLAFLSSLVQDAFALADYLGANNRRRMRAVTALADPAHEAWALLGEDRDDAYAAWKLLAGLT
jgi:hypothetical protein